MSTGPQPWRQQHWDWRAAANFVLGGAGSGLALFAALAAPSAGWQGLLVVALALIGTGLACVWLEIGRPLRALNVFVNPRTSWMSRESYVALLLFAIAAAALAIGGAALRVALGVAALAFLFSQARILHASKGIPAWREPKLVPLVIATGIAEGGGIALALDAALKTQPWMGLSLFTVAVIARALLLGGYLREVGPALDREARETLTAAGKVLRDTGTVLPLLLLATAILMPQAEAVLSAFAGLAAAHGGWRFKALLVTRAAFNQGFSIAALPVRGTRPTSTSTRGTP